MQREIATKHRISDLESKIWLLNKLDPGKSKRNFNNVILI